MGFCPHSTLLPVSMSDNAKSHKLVYACPELSPYVSWDVEAWTTGSPTDKGVCRENTLLSFLSF